MLKSLNREHTKDIRKPIKSGYFNSEQYSMDRIFHSPVTHECILCHCLKKLFLTTEFLRIYWYDSLEFNIESFKESFFLFLFLMNLIKFKTYCNVWLGLVSLLNSISTFMGYLMPMPYNLIDNSGDEGVQYLC